MGRGHRCATAEELAQLRVEGFVECGTALSGGPPLGSPCSWTCG